MKRNFLLTLLLTLLPLVGWAEVTFRIGSTDLPNPYYVASDAEANFTVYVYLNGQAVSDWVWQKKDGDTWTTINGDAGLVTGPGIYKASGFGTTAEGPAEGTFEVIVGIPTPVSVAEIVGGSSYSTLQSAFEAVQDGQTIRMLENVNLTEIVKISKDVTLDLNGKTITVPAANGNTQIEEPFIVKRGGKFTVTDNSTDKNGEIDASECMVGIKMTEKADGASGDPATLIVKAGTIKGENYGISGNGKRNNTAVTIEGGTIIATSEDDGTGIYNPQAGTLTISGGKIEGYNTAVEVRSGIVDVTVTGGEFVARCDDLTVTGNSNGTTTKGAAFAIAQHTTQQDITVTIKGGTFRGKAALSIANPQNNEATNVAVSVTGGRFDGEIVIANSVPASFNKKILAGGEYSEKPDDEYVADGYDVFDNEDDTYRFAVFAEYDWTMANKEGYYQASVWDPGITVTTSNGQIVPEFRDASGQVTAKRNWIARFFTARDSEQGFANEVDGMRHVGEYWVQPYLVSYDGENMKIGKAIGEPKNFTIKQPDLKLRLSQIYPFFHQKNVYAEWTTEGYKKVSTDPNSIDNENNTKVVNITYVQDPESDGFKGKPLSERLSDPTDEWWNDPEFDWEAAKKLRATEIDNFKLVNNLYNYSASGNLLRAFVIDDGKIYEDYKIQMQVPGYAWLEKNNAVIELNAEEDLNPLNKVYGDKDSEEPFAIVTDQDEADMSADGYGADITITTSREKEGLYEDAGKYDVYVDITGSDFVNYNFTGEYDETVEIEGGMRYIFKDAFTIDQYDLSTDETMAAIPDDPETTDVDESEPAKEEKVIISIKDVTYDGTYQQVKPQIVKFLDLNNVLAPVDGKPVTSNEYVPQIPAIPDDPETTDVDESAPAQFGYVILAEDIPAVAAVEDNTATPDVDESAPAQDAVKGDWRLAYLKADGKGSQKGVDSETEYTYYYNRWVSRQANGTVDKNVGECNIMVVADNTETAENEGSINFCGQKTGNFTVNPRDLHVRVAASKATFGTTVGDIIANCTLEEVETAATDDGFVTDEKTGVKDNFPVDKVKLVTPNVEFHMPMGYTGNIDKYTITASLKEGVNRKNVALNYNVIFDEFTDNFEVTPLMIQLNAIAQAHNYPAPVEGVYAEPVASKGENTGTFEIVNTTVGTATIDVKDAENNSITLPDGVQLSDLVTLTCDVTKIGTTEGALVLHEIKTRTGAAANVQFTMKNGDLTINPLNEIRLAYDNVEQALQDHKGYGAGENEEMTVYMPKRRLKTNTWYSMVLPFRFYVPSFSNKMNYASVALLSETQSGNDVHFNTNVGYVEANTPFLFKVAPDETKSGDATTWSADELAAISFEKVKIGDNFDYNGEEDPFVQTHEGGPKFIGSYKTVAYSEAAKYYVAKEGVEPNEWFVSTADGKFYRGNDNNKDHNILTTEAYLSFPVASNDVRIFIDDEEGNATAIYGIGAEPAEIAASKNAEGVYNLSGQRVSRAQKGIFIMDGKKVLVK